MWAAERPVRAPISDDRHVTILIHLKAVGPIGVRFATARHGRKVGLHELLKPRAHMRRLVLPLSKIPRCRRRRQQDERNDDAAHIRLFRPHPASPMGVGPTIKYVDPARTSLARNCCEFTCLASIACPWPSIRDDFARRGARIHSPIKSQPKYERGNGGMESDQPEYARPKPQRQLHLPLYD